MERLFWGVRSLCFFKYKSDTLVLMGCRIGLNFGWWSNLEFGPFSTAQTLPMIGAFDWSPVIFS